MQPKKAEDRTQGPRKVASWMQQPLTQCDRMSQPLTQFPGVSQFSSQGLPTGGEDYIPWGLPQRACGHLRRSFHLERETPRRLKSC